MCTTTRTSRDGGKEPRASRNTDPPLVDRGKVYEFSGSFKNLILTLSWMPRDDTSLERGTLTVKLVENGRKFVGHGAFYSPATERVHASTFEAVRQS